jgi:hypothetical protein
MSEYAVSFQNQPVDVSEEFSKQENHFFWDRGSRSSIGLALPGRSCGKAWH